MTAEQAALMVESDMYFVEKSRMPNTATATSQAFQSTNNIIPIYIKKPLPPLKLYHTGKQLPIMQNKPEYAAPNCQESEHSLKKNADRATGIMALKRSRNKTSIANLLPKFLLKFVKPGLPLPQVRISFLKIILERIIDELTPAIRYDITAVRINNKGFIVQ